MSRFIEVENRMINVDHIMEVIDHEDGTITICLGTGDTIKTESCVAADIKGSRHVVSIIPCGKNLWAELRGTDGMPFGIEVGHLLLMADGSYYPLEAAMIETASGGDNRLVRFFFDDEADDVPNDDNDDPFVGWNPSFH